MNTPQRQTKELYDGIPHLEEQTRHEGHEGIVMHNLKKYLPLGKGLNIGSGTMPKLENVINLDFTLFDNIDIQADGYHLPFKDNTFDFVYTVSYLEYVNDLRLALQEIHRVVKNNGRIFLGETIDINHILHNLVSLVVAYNNKNIRIDQFNGLSEIQINLNATDRLMFETELEKLGKVLYKDESKGIRLLKYDYEIEVLKNEE